MRNKVIAIGVCLLIFLLPLWSVAADNSAADEVNAIINGIIAQQSGGKTVQQWLDGPLADAPEASEWYALALCQYGEYDLSAYEAALTAYVSENTVHAASSRQKYALTLVACGSTHPYIGTVLNDSIGKQGLMSWVFGLHLLNNGYTAAEHTVDSVTKRLLSLQHEDGGWSVTGNYGDTDATAMAVQALAPQYKSHADVAAAIDRALVFLSGKQNPEGDYASYGVANPESTAQVLVALAALGVDGLVDERFIKNGNTLLEGICRYRLSDGSFSHTLGGAYNPTATVQVFFAMVAHRRLLENNAPIYLLDARNPAGLPQPPTTTVNKPTTTIQATAKPTTTRPVATTAVTPTSATTTAWSTVTTAATSVATTYSSAAPTAAPLTEPSHNDYRPWATVAIAAVAAIVGTVLLLMRKRAKDLLIVLVIAAVLIGGVWLLDIQSTDAYYQNSDNAGDTIGEITLSIRCDAIPDKSAAHVPDDGVLLPTTTVSIAEGDTVYSVLRAVAAENRLHLETSGAAGAEYVQGIGNIYEFDFGDLSGWTYTVNGEKTLKSCGEYRLSPGDTVEWLYTCNLGDDLK
ncbi:MAG: DUF4430 domain-containing protein [Clostridia bacterium]|nr:DUF4430 domain-containing protein [Clostridia bacterium]